MDWQQVSSEGGQATWVNGCGSRVTLRLGQRPGATVAPGTAEPIRRTALPMGEQTELDQMHAVLGDAIQQCQRDPHAHQAVAFTLRLLRNAVNDQFHEGLPDEAWRAPAGTLPDFATLSAQERRQVEVLRAFGTKLLALIQKYRNDASLSSGFWRPFLAIQGALNRAFPPEPIPPAAETETEQSPAGTTETVQPEASGETQSASGAQPDAAEAGQAQTEASRSETLGKTELGAEQAETGSRCSVCRLDAETRAKIAYKLGAGESLRSVASRFGVSLSALFRHSQHAVNSGA